MLHEFLDVNRAELIERCRGKVSRRSSPRPTLNELQHGIPSFLGQLIGTLRAEHAGGATGDLSSEIAATATRHGHDLLRRGFTVEQVVHDYGDLCQAVTELAVERNVPVSAGEFHTFNLCLDNAIADAVTAFGSHRDRMVSEQGNRATSERLGFLAHELRNSLNTAMLAFAAIQGGGVGPHGATAVVLERSFLGLRDLINRALAEVRLEAGVPLQHEDVNVRAFIAEVQLAAGLEARARDCEFSVPPVDQRLVIRVDKQMLYSAVSNLLQNAFKFTPPRGIVSLEAYGTGDRVFIEVADECGGLPAGKAEAMFLPFQQHGADRSGLGLGLSISRRAVEASGGTLHVRDISGIGCVFTVDLPARLAGEPQADVRQRTDDPVNAP